MSQLQKLLNAHIEYEVSAWKGENLKKSLKFEIESLYDAIVEIEAENIVDAVLKEKEMYKSFVTEMKKL